MCRPHMRVFRVIKYWRNGGLNPSTQWSFPRMTFAEFDEFRDNK